MPGLSRVGDTNNVSGQIMRGAKTVFCNGLSVGLHVSQITPHEPWGRSHGPHEAAVTTQGSPTVFAEGSQVLRIGSATTCQEHPIVQGSGDVFVP